METTETIGIPQRNSSVSRTRGVLYMSRLYRQVIRQEENVVELLDKKLEKMIETEPDYSEAAILAVNSLSKRLGIGRNIMIYKLDYGPEVITDRAEYIEYFYNIIETIEELKNQQGDQELKVGEIVKVIDHSKTYKSSSWDLGYFIERNKDLPIGSVGKIIEKTDAGGESGFLVEFAEDKEYTRSSSYYIAGKHRPSNVGHFRFNELAANQEINQYDATEMNVGSLVRVARHNWSQFNRSYCDERNKNFPIGTIGQLIEINQSEQRGVAEFPKEKYSWSQDWRYGETKVKGKNSGVYKIDELDLVNFTNIKNEFKKYKSEDEAIAMIVKEEQKKAEIQANINKYESEFQELIKQGVQSMKRLNYNNQKIIEFFKDRINHTFDVEVILGTI